MTGTFIILIAYFAYLRKALRTKTELPYWDKLFLAGLYSAIAMLATSIMFRQTDSILMWVAHVMVIGLVYICITAKALKPVKSVAFALLPMIVIDFIEDIVKTVREPLYDQWENYFEAATTFGIVWLAIMLFVNNRQRKALAKERAKAEEIEKEYQLSQTMKAALEIQVAERTEALNNQKNELQKTLDELTITQAQLIQSEKMASLGELTAGIAHEIQNPLNFVNNFSEVSAELISELNEELEKGNTAEVKILAKDLISNLQKINHHGKRAADIVKGMLQHSRTSTGQKEATDINALCDEYLRLAYHGLRAKDKSFNAKFDTHFDESVGKLNIIPQDMGRVILNLINNAFYAVNEKAKLQIEGYEPIVTITSKKENKNVIISIADNGKGIPPAIKEKIFQPFFTTKPTGQGTGLGLSLSYDIVKAHSGELRVDSKEGEGTVFKIVL
jgi:two-component system, NtrC family, sensor kinase